MRILLTGGTGFIGSHTALACLEAGLEPILLDNFSNSDSAVVDRLREISKHDFPIAVGDVRDQNYVRSVLAHYEAEAVIHFAAHKSVAESTADPLLYHANNVGGTLALLQAMEAEGIRTIVFSSSATVYGEPQELPIKEEHPTRAVNPYGQTKLICEDMLSSLAGSRRGWRVSLLRYFNPVGAHPSGLIGENPKGIPTNVMPLITRVGQGKMASLPIYGVDYPTADGSAVRDYIHVMDLAEGHAAALEALSDGDELQTYNLGTGHGTSVLELVATFEQVTDAKVPHHAANRRPGDVAMLYASADKAAQMLGWRAKRSIADMCRDSWRFCTG
jgi:UDP-glucose 4-epimerase